MGQSVTNLAGAAMRQYDKVIHEQVFIKNVLFSNILRNIATSQGTTTKYISLHYQRNTGSAALSEAGILPTAGNQGYVQANVTMKYNFHTISLTDVSLQASKRSKEFLVDALESEYNGAKSDMQRQLSRQGYGIGTGAICRVNDASPDTTLTFDTPFAGKYPMEYFSIGNGVMFSSAVDAATSAFYTEFTAITGNYTGTVNLATSIADDDYVFIAHDNNTVTPTVSNVNLEIMGLAGLIDDGTNLVTLEGLSRSTYIWWKSYVNDSASQRSLTDALLHDTYLEARKKGKTKYILTHPDITSAYGQFLSPDRRYTTQMELKGGFTGIQFNDIIMVDDYDCPYDEAYFIDPTSLSVEDLAPMSFLQEDGSILDRSSTTPAWTATLKYYANLASKSCNKNAALRDVVK